MRRTQNKALKLFATALLALGVVIGTASSAWAGESADGSADTTTDTETTTETTTDGEDALNENTLSDSNTGSNNGLIPVAVAGGLVLVVIASRRLAKPSLD